MALVFQRRLALPLWGIVLATIAVTAPPPARRILIVVVGIAVIAFVLGGLARRLRPARSVADTASSRQRHRPSAALSMAGGTSVRTLNELKPNPADEVLGSDEADEALDLVRVDEDGSWQMPRRRRAR